MIEAGRITPSTSRKSSGKKIDTWIFHHPACDSVRIDVSLHSSGHLFFAAKALDGPIAGQSWEASDIENLRTMIRDDISSAVAALTQTDWRPSLLAQLHPDTSARGDFTAGFRISFDRIQADRSRPRTNSGKVRVIHGQTISSITERSLAEVRPDDVVCGMRTETPHTAAITNAGNTSEQDAQELCAILNRFTRLLGERLGPDRIASGLPEGAELVRLMQDAAKQP